jgi:phenylacetate-CoA ligase
MVRHAYECVPFYRRRFDDAGLRPEDVRGIEDLARLPLLTRAELQATPITDRLAWGFDLDRLLVSRTSGATGRPMMVAHTVLEHRLRAAFVLGAMRRYGLRLTDLQVGLYHQRPAQHWPVPFTARLGLLRHAGVTVVATRSAATRGRSRG